MFHGYWIIIIIIVIDGAVGCLIVSCCNAVIRKCVTHSSFCHRWACFSSSLLATSVKLTASIARTRSCRSRFTCQLARADQIFVVPDDLSTKLQKKVRKHVVLKIADAAAISGIHSKAFGSAQYRCLTALVRVFFENGREESLILQLFFFGVTTSAEMPKGSCAADCRHVQYSPNLNRIN